MDARKKMWHQRMRELENKSDFNSTEEEENPDMYGRVKQKKTVKKIEEETTDNQDDGTGTAESTEVEGEENEKDEGGEDNQKCYDFRQRKVINRYQAPLAEPRHKSKSKIFFRDSASPVRRRYQYGSPGPRSPFRKRRLNRDISSSSSSSSDEEQIQAQKHFERRRVRGRSRAPRRCQMDPRKEVLSGIAKGRLKRGARLTYVDPVLLDRSVRFSSVGGLTHHINKLREMIVFPLLYPEMFKGFSIQPPRGCLFYGPPGTGKTLVARALANECTEGNTRITFFMMKGADCLSKWLGESEQKLRLLFNQAGTMQPSIIFIDEIDGLAPVRSSRQDHTHSSLVSTLLTEMDGVDDRGKVVVIGATNRLDSIDPALRRPGRFDKELLFSLPDRDARREILTIHTRDWNPKPSDAFLDELADKCVGYCGADIKALCAEAVLHAFRRCFPELYSASEKLQLDLSSIAITNKDFRMAMNEVVPASKRVVTCPRQALSSITRPLSENTLKKIIQALQRIFPHAEQGLKRNEKTDMASHVQEDYTCSDGEELYISEDGPSQKGHGKQKATGTFLHFDRSAHQPTSFIPRLLLAGRPGSGQRTHLAPALLHTLEKFSVYPLDIPDLCRNDSISVEETCNKFREAKKTAPSILYIPDIDMWWETVNDVLRATFVTLLKSIPSLSPVLLLATCDIPYEDLPEKIKDIFLKRDGHVFTVELPSSEERKKFFEDLILCDAAKPPTSRKKAAPSKKRHQSQDRWTCGTITKKKKQSYSTNDDEVETEDKDRDEAMLRMTRAKHSQLGQQQNTDVEKALASPSTQTPQLIVDHERLRNLLKRVTEKTKGFTMLKLEKLHAGLSQCIYRHRKDYNKAELIQNMEKEVENFKDKETS